MYQGAPTGEKLPKMALLKRLRSTQRTDRDLAVSDEIYVAISVEVHLSAA